MGLVFSKYIEFRARDAVTSLRFHKGLVLSLQYGVT